MDVTPLKNANLAMAPESTTRKKSLRVCGRSEVDVVVSNCGVTVAPVEVVCVKPGTPARMPLAPGNVPKRWSNDRFCMITTTTFLIDAACVTGVGVGVGVIDEPFTPPHPIVRARARELKKHKNARLKGTHTSLSLSQVASL